MSDEDIETIAAIIGRKFSFGRVHGIPSGGLRLAAALEKFRSSNAQTLIVDDVLTTGTSMREARLEVGPDAVGVVIFSRGQCPSWIHPIFQLAEWVGS